VYFFAGQKVIFLLDKKFFFVGNESSKSYFLLPTRIIFAAYYFFLQFKSTFFAMRPTAQKYSLAAQTYFFLRPKSAVQKYFFRTFGQNALVLQ